MELQHPPHHLPNLGTRISLNGHIGTVRYAGNIDNTQGMWLGIEWDDPSRGKHNGVKDGKRYFNCLVPGSGSFTRPSSKISYGQSFLQALHSKYVDIARGSEQKETVTLGSSNGAIEVEAVGLDKIRGKLAKLGRLRQVSLDTDNVASADPPGSIKNTCPDIRVLDLSNNLLPSWEVIAMIAAELTKLETLSLNRSRLAGLSGVSSITTAFASLRELRINRTMVSWNDATLLMSAMPELYSLELGYNGLKLLGRSNSSRNLASSKLEILNFDGNELQDWLDTMRSVSGFSKLTRIILTSNKFSTIPLPHNQEGNRVLRHLGLSSNSFNRWSDVDALRAWCPELNTLSISGNPLVDGYSNFRPLVIARMPSLTSLNGTTISPKERDDSELFYLSQAAQRHSSSSEEDMLGEHPLWKELCEKHGEPEGGKFEKVRNTLGQQLIQINIYRCASEPPNSPSELNRFRSCLISPLVIRVLPTMTFRVFRLKLFKSLHVAPQSQIRVWLMMHGHEMAELDVDQDTRDLAWWGILNGSDVVVYVP